MAVLAERGQLSRSQAGLHLGPA